MQNFFFGFLIMVGTALKASTACGSCTWFPFDYRCDCCRGQNEQPFGTCQDCGQGQSSNGGDNPPCHDCPPGTFGPSSQNDQCQQCSSGYYSLGRASSCTICPEGKYGDVPASGECHSCPPGKISSVGSTSINNCHTPCPDTPSCSTSSTGTTWKLGDPSLVGRGFSILEMAVKGPTSQIKTVSYVNGKTLMTVPSGDHRCEDFASSPAQLSLGGIFTKISSLSTSTSARQTSSINSFAKEVGRSWGVTSSVETPAVSASIGVNQQFTSNAVTEFSSGSSVFFSSSVLQTFSIAADTTTPYTPAFVAAVGDLSADPNYDVVKSEYISFIADWGTDVTEIVCFGSKVDGATSISWSKCQTLSESDVKTCIDGSVGIDRKGAKVGIELETCFQQKSSSLNSADEVTLSSNWQFFGGYSDLTADSYCFSNFYQGAFNVPSAVSYTTRPIYAEVNSLCVSSSNSCTVDAKVGSWSSATQKTNVVNNLHKALQDYLTMNARSVDVSSHPPVMCAHSSAGSLTRPTFFALLFTVAALSCQCL